MTRWREDEKDRLLRKQGCRHPHPEKVSDELFAGGDFFDPRDLIQVKYEMLRCVEVDRHTVARSAASFGLSRVAFYHAQAAFGGGGLAALRPAKRGPRRAHKLSEEVVDFMLEARQNDLRLSTSGLAALIEQRFAITAHRRSIERALARRGKKPQ